MANLPSGTVTFLFTDIEGSTRLWEQHPEAMRAALARHDALLHHAIASHGGHVFKTMGDQFCAAFATTPEAVAAALDAQFALQAEAWPDLAPLRVRMALHTGAAEARSGDYLGPALNRVARLLAAGHGDQILFSQAAGDLARDTLPPEASLRDLGAHRLKDLQQPEHLFQLLSPRLPGDFPPLRSLESFAHNLPAQLTRFIGRGKEIAEIKALLATTRLLTLAGSGGCGKTRLALQVSAEVLEEYADGVWLVELAALADPALVPQTVASVLGVREEPNRPLAATLSDYLRAKSLLLVLDNCEHLLTACAQLADALLRACPRLQILASSREGLCVTGETTYRVPSLSLPDPRRLPPVDQLMQCEALRLFVDRAVAALPSFSVTAQNAPALAQVCQRLDGIPLAIELAAARVRALPLEKLNERLDDMFRLLTGGSRTALPRQQTLRALIDWSYDLLSLAEKALQRRLAVFAGGWTLEAAVAVCVGEEVEEWEVLDLLTSLVDKSLVLYEERKGEGRYRLLETVRQYSRDRLLESGEAEGVRGRHCAWFLQSVEPEAQSVAPDRLDGLEREFDNLRAALAWTVAQGQAEMGLRLGGSLWRFWLFRGYLREGREHLAELLEVPGARAHTAARGYALSGAGRLAYGQGDHEAAWVLLGKCLAIFRELGDQREIAGSLSSLGLVASAKEDYGAARVLLEESLTIYRELSDRDGTAWSLLRLWEATGSQEGFVTARALLEESLTIFRDLGNLQGAAFSLRDLGWTASEEGQYGAARALMEESLTIFWEAGAKPWIAGALEPSAAVAVAQGQPGRGACLFGAAEGLREATGTSLRWTDRANHDRCVAAARAALGDEAFAAAWAEGRAMPLESAVEYALAEGEGG